LFAHIKAIPGQRIVSTHSPYFAGQAQLDDLRLFSKAGSDTIVTRLDLSLLTNTDDRRKLQETVIDTRGDLLFSRGLVLFEGQTEEQALPTWAQKYWGTTIHELGLCFVRVNGTDYFPFVWLAKALRIPWYVFADGESGPVKALDAALKKAGERESAHCPNVVVHPDGKNFESQLIAEGYLAEISLALNAMSGSQTYLVDYIADKHGQKAKGGVLRDYKSAGGEHRAALDAMSNAKTSVSKYLGQVITGLKDPTRRFPTRIRILLEIVSAAHGLRKAED
jgi:putative ATP-dependent endonuclease of OLD family